MTAIAKSSIFISQLEKRKQNLVWTCNFQTVKSVLLLFQLDFLINSYYIMLSKSSLLISYTHRIFTAARNLADRLLAFASTSSFLGTKTCLLSCRQLLSIMDLIWSSSEDII